KARPKPPPRPQPSDCVSGLRAGHDILIEHTRFGGCVRFWISPRSLVEEGVASLPLYRQYDFADLLASVHHGVGLCRLAQRESSVDNWPDRAGLQQRPDALAQGPRNPRLEFHRASAQRGSSDRQAPPQDLSAVHLTLCTAQQR